MGEWTGDESICFDRIAARYDDTRGGLRRGSLFAALLDPHLGDARCILEVGVGTGVVATALTERGRTVVGIDLSAAMLERAKERLGPRVTRADAQHLPVGSQRVDAAYLVWVLHLVADPAAVLRECARVLAPGGTLLVIAGPPRTHAEDMTDVTVPLDRLKSTRLRKDTVENVAAWATANGLQQRGVAETDHVFDQSPAELARDIENRVFSFLWDLDERTWNESAQPVVDALRSLPDPDRPRRASHRSDIHIFSA
jgi:ubiquinone/menaquinone biosynthesis C-methylase UbiE